MRSFLPLAIALSLAPFTASARDLAEIKARGELKVLVAADEVPETFSFQPGDAPGLERELIEAFSRLYKLQMKLRCAQGARPRDGAVRPASLQPRSARRRKRL